MELKINESKLLEFDTIIEGGDETDDLVGTLRFTFDDEVEYGFPVKIDGKKIQARVPSLKDYISESRLRTTKNVHARLDVVAKGKLFTPWADKINLEIPLEVKAEMTDMKQFLEEADNFIVSAKIKEEKKVKVKEINEEKEDEKVVDKKKQSRFSKMMKEEKKCPEGQRY